MCIRDRVPGAHQIDLLVAQGKVGIDGELAVVDEEAHLAQPAAAADVAVYISQMCIRDSPRISATRSANRSTPSAPPLTISLTLEGSSSKIRRETLAGAWRLPITATFTAFSSLAVTAVSYTHLPVII